MKKKGFGLIASCVGVLAVVLAFVSLAFNWITSTLGKTSEPMARGDWNKLLQAEISEVNMSVYDYNSCCCYSCCCFVAC